MGGLSAAEFALDGVARPGALALACAADGAFRLASLYGLVAGRICPLAADARRHPSGSSGSLCGLDRTVGLLGRLFAGVCRTNAGGRQSAEVAGRYRSTGRVGWARAGTRSSDHRLFDGAIGPYAGR